MNKPFMIKRVHALNKLFGKIYSELKLFMSA